MNVGGVRIKSIIKDYQARDIYHKHYSRESIIY